MLPELVVLAGRAAAARVLLDQLLDVVPGDYWIRRAEGELWSAMEHLEHVATVDEPLRELVRDAASGTTLLRPYGTSSLTEASQRREALMLAVEGQPVPALRARMANTRGLLLQEFTRLDVTALEAEVLLPGVVNAWGQPLTISLRRYLATWARHDAEHTEAIRQAITTPPSPSDFALAARRHRR